MKSLIPVHSISDFDALAGNMGFYISRLNSHINNHNITGRPHKHDFYFVVLFTAGKGTHEIDFEHYDIKPGSVFIMKPGQMHTWSLSKDIDGYVFFHTRLFFDEGFTINGVNEFDFYNSYQYSPLIKLKPGALIKLRLMMEELEHEFSIDLRMKKEKIRAVLNLFYIEISRLLAPLNNYHSPVYQSTLKQFESLVNENFRSHHQAGDYASLLHITEKHLNRICKTLLNKTSTQLISDRIILEARRLLIQGKLSIAGIAEFLGYDDAAYFSRFFKKNTGFTPRRFTDGIKISKPGK